MNIAIIPARSGSKRIKKKNIKNFFNKPILLHVIDNLKKVNKLDYIVVSSDSNEILKIANKGGADLLIKRPKNLSDDKTDIKSVIKHAIRYLEKSIKIDKVLCIFPTAVFTKPLTINKAFIKEKKTNKLIFSATKFNHPIERSFFLKNKKLSLNYPNLIGRRTQDLKENFHDAAQFYLASKNKWLNNDSIISKKSIFLEIPALQSQDIDNENDWEIAEKLWRIQNTKNKYFK